MSTLKNSVRLMGRLGIDPEIRKFGDDKSLARVCIATNNHFKNNEGEWITETQWHNLVLWNSQAEFAERNLKKGVEIAIEGKLTNQSYTSKDGITRYFTEVSVNEVKLLTKKEIEQ